MHVLQSSNFKVWPTTATRVTQWDHKLHCSIFTYLFHSCDGCVWASIFNEDASQYYTFLLSINGFSNNWLGDIPTVKCRFQVVVTGCVRIYPCAGGDETELVGDGRQCLLKATLEVQTLHSLLRHSADHQRRSQRARRKTETDGNCLIRLSVFAVAADTTQPVNLAEMDIMKYVALYMPAERDGRGRNVTLGHLQCQSVAATGRLYSICVCCYRRTACW